METTDQVSIAALDLVSGAGAEDLAQAHYDGRLVALEAYSYSADLKTLGISPGRLEPVTGGEALPAPAGHYARSAGPDAPGTWEPIQDGALNSLQITPRAICSRFEVRAVPLGITNDAVRSMIWLGGDRVELFTAYGNRVMLDVTRAQVRTSSTNIWPVTAPSSIQSAVRGSDGRVWISAGSTRTPGTYELLVEDPSTFELRTLPRRSRSELYKQGVYSMAVSPTDPSRIYSETYGGAVLLYDDTAKRWTKLAAPLRSEDVICATTEIRNGLPAHDNAPPNYYCGGLFFEPSGALLSFDLAGLEGLRRLESRNGTVAITHEALIDDPPSALPTVVGPASEGILAVRGTLTQSTLQVRRQGHFEHLVGPFNTLRLFAVAPIGPQRNLLAGLSGTVLETYQGQICPSSDIPIGTHDAIGGALRTEHAVVFSLGEKQVDAPLLVLVYWIVE